LRKRKSNYILEIIETATHLLEVFIGKTAIVLTVHLYLKKNYNYVTFLWRLRIQNYENLKKGSINL